MGEIEINDQELQKRIPSFAQGEFEKVVATVRSRWM